MAHDRVTQVQRPGVHRLDPLHTRQDRTPLFGTAQVSGQHRVAVAQLADVGNAFHQRRYLRWSKHFAGPLAILGMVGELHGIEWPDIHADPLHGEHRRAVSGMAEDHVGLDGKQMRCTFHANFPKLFQKYAARSMNPIATCTTGQGHS